MPFVICIWNRPFGLRAAYSFFVRIVDPYLHNSSFVQTRGTAHEHIYCNSWTSICTLFSSIVQMFSILFVFIPSALGTHLVANLFFIFYARSRQCKWNVSALGIFALVRIRCLHRNKFTSHNIPSCRTKWYIFYLTFCFNTFLPCIFPTNSTKAYTKRAQILLRWL